MSARQLGSRSGRTLSWLGIAAIAGGLTLIWLYFDHPQLSKNPNIIFPLMYLGAGCVLIVWGLRSLSDDAVALLGRLRHRTTHQYRVRMPREAVVYGLMLVVLCAGALWGGSNMLMLVFGLMAGPFVLNGQVTLGILKRLSVARELPVHATVGEKFSVRLTLTNGKRLMSSWMVSAEDVVEGPGEQLQPVALFACVPAASTRSAFYEICAARRGIYEFGPVRVVSRFPLGLMERSIELGNVERLVIYPQIGRMKPRWRESAETGDMASETSAAGVGASSDEFHRLREYRGGDAPRSIHWRTTARRNELMVREFQHSRRNDLLLAVELWLPPRPGPSDYERVELAVSFAASICVDHLQRTTDSTVDLVVCGSQLRQGSGWTGATALGGMLEELALAEGGPAAGLTHAALAAAAAAPVRVRKVLVTSRSAAVPGNGAAENPRRDLGARHFEVFEASPEQVLEYLDFNRQEPGGTR